MWNQEREGEAIRRIYGKKRGEGVRKVRFNQPTRRSECGVQARAARIWRGKNKKKHWRRIGGRRKKKKPKKKKQPSVPQRCEVLDQPLPRSEKKEAKPRGNEREKEILRERPGQGEVRQKSSLFFRITRR